MLYARSSKFIHQTYSNRKNTNNHQINNNGNGKASTNNPNGGAPKCIKGYKIRSVRADGTFTQNAVYVGGKDPDGNLLCFEIVGDHAIRGKINGRAKYARVPVQRVFPVVDSSLFGEREEITLITE